MMVMLLCIFYYFCVRMFADVRTPPLLSSAACADSSFISRHISANLRIPSLSFVGLGGKSKKKAAGRNVMLERPSQALPRILSSS